MKKYISIDRWAIENGVLVYKWTKDISGISNICIIQSTKRECYPPAIVPLTQEDSAKFHSNDVIFDAKFLTVIELKSGWTEWKESNDGTCREMRKWNSDDISTNGLVKASQKEYRKRTTTTSRCGNN